LSLRFSHPVLLGCQAVDEFTQKGGEREKREKGEKEEKKKRKGGKK
jgi:hypothetical protein